jgi:hypothetical protein
VLVVPGAIVIAGLSVHQWRELMMARLFRVDNDVVVAVAPSGFRPGVRAGFRAKVVARGFKVIS